MINLELRKQYQLSEVIETIKNYIKKNGYSNEDFCLYSNEDIASPNLTCYLERNPTITENDEEIYPKFVVENSLELFYDGQQFEDVISSVLDQKENASIENFILALNYYMENDDFLDLE